MAFHRGVSAARLQQMRRADEKEFGKVKGAQKTAQRLTEALKKKELRPQEFSIRALAEGLIPNGREYVQEYLNPAGSRSSFMEAASEVHSALFANITGQLIFSEILDRYEDEEFVFSKIVPNKPSQFLDMEKVPGYGRQGEITDAIKEGDPYPLAGISENYVEIGSKQKRGRIVPVTREAIFSDRTGEILDAAGEVGHWVGFNKEVRIIDAFVDENTGAKSAILGGHRYHWKSTSYATYQTTTPWDNVWTDVLTDWTDLNSAWQTLAAITDPFTGAPIMITPKHLVVTNENVFTAHRILHATEVRSGDITAGTGDQTLSANPVGTVMPGLTVVSSRLFTTRVSDTSNWYLGDIGAMVRYYYNWDLETSQAPANNPDEFDRDIAMKFKATERGIASVIEPRAGGKSTA